MKHALVAAGIAKSSPEDVAAAVFKESGGDAVKALASFHRLALNDLDLLKAITKNSLPMLCKEFLRKHAVGFDKDLRRKQSAKNSIPKKDPAAPERMRLYRARKRSGLKIISAEFNEVTGALSILNREAGQFAAIRINGRTLAEVTTEEAMAWCERNRANAAFVEAICRRCPDPRIPIGDQITVGIVREAKGFAEAQE